MANLPPQLPPPAKLLELLMGKLVSDAICAAAEIGVADHLGDVPATSDELARKAEVDAPSLYRLMRALTTVGVFVETERGVFGHTDLSRLLRSNAPESIRPTALMVGSPWHRGAWERLAASVRTGQCSFEIAFGKPMFEFLGGHRDAAQVFDAAMSSLAAPTNAAIVSAYDFSNCGTVVDVGGGRGTLLSAILTRYPSTKGILFDSAHVLGGAKAQLEAAQVARRCSIVEGSFFESVPSGADTYVLKHVIHDWTDERAIAIFTNCARAMSKSGKVLVVERLVPDGNEPGIAKLLDLDMLVLAGGRERTENEVSDLLLRSGLKLSRAISTPVGVSIIEAVLS
jgi:hypothetical protein